MDLKILWAHLRIRFVQLFKEPGYVVSTLIFPALFFLIFALPNADTPDKARFLLGSFSVFAVLGVCFFQFGVHQAQELRTGWHKFLHTLPVPRCHLFITQWVAALVCAVLSAAMVYATIALSTELQIEFSRWLKMVGVLILGAAPFALFSAALARLVSPTAALPTFNLIYILSSFAGGLWLPPNALPAKVEALSHYLPTRHLGEILWKVSLAQDIEWRFAFQLAGFAALALAILYSARLLNRPVR